MIHIIPTQNIKFRTFGWVQDPSDFRSLCDIVAIFDNMSEKHFELKTQIIPSLIEERDGKSRFIEVLNSEPLCIKYADLVGTSFSPRSIARCNGIIQASIPGQKRDFIGDWPADNFVRWAHALGFIQYDYQTDTFAISDSGLRLSQARTAGEELNEQENEILLTAVLSYPPAVRVLKLLAEDENTHLTKFELGSKLGFIGEDGFTSLPQSILIRTLAMTKSNKEKNKMKTDWDGSSDKYARMISKWLEKLGLVMQVPKQVSVNVNGQEFSETIGQAYMISAKGSSALNRVVGRSRHHRISKNVYYEMMATKGNDRELLRTRRTLVLKAIMEKGDYICAYEIKDYLALYNIAVAVETIQDDVRGLINIGLNIIIDEDEFLWNDNINDFILPLNQDLTRTDLLDVKEELREKLTHLSHEYLALIDLAYDSRQHRLFEMKTMELLIEECGYQGDHLGGSRRPDGICYTHNIYENYGIIIDTKAYKDGYNLPITQADEMERYIGDNAIRDTQRNPNKWWEHFSQDIRLFYFMFISGHFKGQYQDKINLLELNTGVCGAAIDIKKLLLTVNYYKAGIISHEDIASDFFQTTNDEADNS